MESVPGTRLTTKLDQRISKVRVGAEYYSKKNFYMAELGLNKDGAGREQGMVSLSKK